MRRSLLGMVGWVEQRDTQHQTLMVIREVC